jgi:hypothetical protein
VLLLFNYYFCGIAIFTFVGLVRITYISSEYKEMHISITDDLKKRFHITCVMRGKNMSQVVIELIEQWLESNEVKQAGEIKRL